MVYDELHGMAERFMADQRGGHTLQATALVNEAWMRMARGAVPEGRGHFLGLAATAMRSILVDHARRRGAVKRGGGERPLPLEAAAELGTRPGSDALLALHESLENLAAANSDAARVAEMRLFGGMEHADVATAMGISRRSVDRLWQVARLQLESDLELE